MSNRKKSKFPGATSISGADTLDFVSAGVNYKISYANFIAGLGVTGTLVQDGSVTGTPVLDTQGTVNNIRNLENGSGVKASVSAENGVTLDHNFINATGGAQLLTDIAQPQPKLRSLQAGSGINIGVAGDTVQISAAAGAAPLSTIIINGEADFPTQSATSITLDAGVTYIIGSAFSTAKNFIALNASKITANNVLSPVLTYTGTSPMFSGVDASFSIKEITIDHPNSEGFHFTDSIGGVIVYINFEVITISGKKYGTFNNVQSVLISGSAGQNVDDGVTVTGANGVIFSLDKLALLSSSPTFKAVDFGSAVFLTIEIIDLILAGPTGSIGISGAANSANVPAGAIATVTGGNFAGIDSPLSIITIDDIRWRFSSNSSIPDTRQDSLTSMTANATETVISAINTPVKVAGVWVDEGTSFFTSDATGRVTYDGEIDYRAPIDFSCTLAMASGGSKSVTAYVATNGVIIPATGRQVTVSSSATDTVTLIWQLGFAQAEYVEVWVENNDDTTNIICTGAVGRVN